MNLHKLILTKNDCYKTGRKQPVQGVMWHSTGANNPNLSRYIGPDDGLLGPNKYNNHWNQAKPGGRNVCVHAFIGKLKNGIVATYQTLPWNHIGWHSGYGPNGSANTLGYVGFECCEDGLNDPIYFNNVCQEGIELTAMILQEYGLPVNKTTVIDHSEGHKLGIASNHADISHWLRKHGKTMDDIREDVKKVLEGRELEMAVYRQGNKGVGVKQLQSDLISINTIYKIGLSSKFLGYGADGSYGPATVDAVKTFQRKYKLVVDGIAGPATQAKIKSLLNAIQTGPTTDKLMEAKKLAQKILDL